MIFSTSESAAPHHPVPDFLARNQTPFHVYYEAEALEDARELRNGLLSGLPGAELFYSVKTNPIVPLLRGLLAAGWGLEVVGPENLRAALAAGSPCTRILFNGAAWSKESLSEALFQHGIRRFTVDSLPMAKLLAETWKSGGAARTPLEVAVRIHDGDSHFGLAPRREVLEPVLAAFPREAVAAFGLHLHANPHGSAPTAAAIGEDFRARARRLREALSALSGTPYPIRYLDLGGGMDSPYVYRPHPRELGSFHNPIESAAFREKFPPARFSLREAGAAIAEAVAAELGAGWARGRILFEPGRAVCTRALGTVVGVRAVKDGLYPDARVLITDGSTSFLGPLHRGVHPFAPAGLHRSFVYGALPHSGDWLFQGIGLPELREGDRLTIGHTGAYFLALEAAFGHDLPAIVRADTGERIRS